MKILICGGAGYIGSHTCVALGRSGHEIVVIDNLCNSSSIAIDRVARLIGSPVKFIRGDIRNPRDLETAFAENVDAVVHFAALKAVGESYTQPLRYFDNNISGTIALLQAMESAGVRKLVFSSSATVYGNAERVPVVESMPLHATNAYARTKLVIEDLIRDYSSLRSDFGAILLRYFNPIGAHESGSIGEDPVGVPENLMPYVTQVAVGRRERLKVFGDDYPTTDGSGVRDYIHVTDLADAHVKALEFCLGRSGCQAFNLGTGRGYSVFELVKAFETATGIPIPLTVVGRRQGDIAEMWADVSLAREVLGWEAQLGLARMCEDAWRWQSSNPRGYQDS